MGNQINYPTDEQASAATKSSTSDQVRRQWLWLASALLVILAVAIRALDNHFLSTDGALESQWFVYLYEHGFRGIGTIDSNYGMVYNLLVWVTTNFGLGPITSIKSITYLFEVILVVLVFAILKDFGHPPSTSLFLAVCILFIPSVILNGPLWGQCDVIYVVFCLASWWAITRHHTTAAWVLFGLAFAFKIQAVFFLPYLVYCYCRDIPFRGYSVKVRVLNLLSPVLAMITFYICQTPGLLTGRSLLNILISYFDFLSPLTGNGQMIFGGGVANVWQLMGQTSGVVLGIVPSAVLFTLGLVIVLVTASLVRLRTDGFEEQYYLSMVLLILSPYFLPYMHERYFMGAEVFAVVFAMITRSRVLIATAVLLQFTMMPGYSSYLFQANVSTLTVTPAMMALVNGVVLFGLLALLFRKPERTADAG